MSHTLTVLSSAPAARNLEDRHRDQKCRSVVFGGESVNNAYLPSGLKHTERIYKSPSFAFSSVNVLYDFDKVMVVEKRKRRRKKKPMTYLTLAPVSTSNICALLLHPVEK